MKRSNYNYYRYIATIVLTSDSKVIINLRTQFTLSEERVRFD